MSRYTKLLWRVFWATSIPYGLWMGLSMGAMALLTSHFPIRTAAFTAALCLVSGVFFGTFMALSLGELHRRGLRQRGFTPTAQNLAVVHRRAISLRLPYSQAFDRCREALSRLPRTAIQQEDRSIGILVARCGTTWASWGERIVLYLQPEADGTTRVAFNSRPILRSTIIDYGKNLENVERIWSCLVSHEA